jgi:hypothetical protein
MLMGRYLLPISGLISVRSRGIMLTALAYVQLFLSRGSAVIGRHCSR